MTIRIRVLLHRKIHQSIELLVPQLPRKDQNDKNDPRDEATERRPPASAPQYDDTSDSNLGVPPRAGESRRRSDTGLSRK